MLFVNGLEWPNGEFNDCDNVALMDKDVADFGLLLALSGKINVCECDDCWVCERLSDELSYNCGCVNNYFFNHMMIKIVYIMQSYRVVILIYIFS